MYHLSVLAENKPGVLMRIAGVVTARGLNIDRVSVEPEGAYSAIRLSFQTDEIHHDRIRRKVRRLVEVIAVHD